MAASVQVLCPNGRRQNVKINPNTKLLQILEEVCQRQGFVPPENYILVQGRKELDLSLSVRFSSLPNNAKLELAKAASARVEQDVKIALQLDSGQRLQGTFKPSTTLWDLLLQLENEHSEHKDILSKVDRSTSPALHPVCIFMREEIIGMRALQEMNLKKLGLTSGNAIIRLLHRPVEESILQEIELKLEKEKEKQAKLEEIAQKKSELQQMIPEDNRSDETSSDLDQKVEQKSPSILDLESSAQKHGEPGDLHPEPMDTLENESSLSMSSSASEPSPAKQRPAHPKKNSKTFTHDSQSSSAGATAKTVQFSGVTEITDDEFQDLSPQEQAIARRLVAKYLPQSSSDTEEPPSFADFKFPEATKGMDLSGSDRKQMTEESLPSCDREAIIFRTDEPLSHESSQVDSIPEDFFEITQSDVKILYRDLQSAVQQLEDQPLMTKAMKRAQTEALYDQYERVVIRVQFPEKLTLQGVFRPRELVSALYSFVQEHLENKKISFYLYTTPPKFILKDKKSTLSSNHLAPAVIVYFGSDSHQDHYLSETTRQLLKTRLKAEAIVNTILQPSVPESETKKIEESRPASSRSQVASTSQGSLSSGAHIPKWLRL
ncbi:tether containing UBX domain for GLUT4, partial [Biomphalaria glabrata]